VLEGASLLLGHARLELTGGAGEVLRVFNFTLPGGQASAQGLT
jgi:hypothetical protein